MPTTYSPIFSITGPQVGPKKPYSPNLFNTSTGVYGTGTYPIHFSYKIDNKIPYHTGSQVVSTAPVIIVQPVNITLTDGGVAGAIGVMATGTLPLTFTWYRDNLVSTGGGVTDTNVDGSTASSSIIIPAASSENGTVWYCIVGSAPGNTQTNNATITVNSASSTPAISSTSALSFSAATGSTPYMYVAATGTHPLTFTWYKGISIVDTQVDPALPSGFDPYIFTTGGVSKYTLPSVISGATYYCHVSNGIGSVDSSPFTMTVGDAPVISSGTLAAVTVTEGDTYSRTVTLSAGVPSGYYWMVKPTSDTSYDVSYIVWSDTFNITGTSVYNGPALTIGSNGKYLSCTVINDYGSAHTNAALITVNAAIIAAPTVVTDPSNVTYSTDPVNFTAVFTGPFLTFQWETRGVLDIAWYPSSQPTSSSNAFTSTLTDITFDKPSINGMKYRCTATNSAGSVTTNYATLTVGTPPLIVSSIAVSPASHLLHGYPDYIQYTATATYSDASTGDVTNSCTWASSDISKVLIFTSGSPSMAQSQGVVGTVDITAQVGAATGTATCTVDSATLSSLTISPLYSSIAVGSTVAFSSTGHWSDLSTSTLTAGTKWSSSSTGVATIGSPYPLGLGWPTASGISAGSTTITGTAGPIIVEKSASTTLTVTSGGGGGGTTLYFRPTTGTGSSTFSGAIDTTSMVVDSNTESYAETGPGDQNPIWIFSGFGTGVQTGEPHIRVTGGTEYSADPLISQSSYITFTYSINGGSSWNDIFHSEGGSGDPSSATVLFTYPPVTCDMADFQVKLELFGCYNLIGGDPAFPGVKAWVDIFDIVFLTS